MTDELDTNVELYPVWRQTLKVFLEAGFTYGDIVEHDWFLTRFGLPTLAEQERMIYAQVKDIRLKRLGQFEPLQAALLHQYQIDLQSEPGVGYRLVPPRDQLERAYKEGMRIINKTYRDMLDRGTNVNTGMLTAEERRQQADILARIAMLRGMLRPTRELPPMDEE